MAPLRGRIVFEERRGRRAPPIGEPGSDRAEYHPEMARAALALLLVCPAAAQVPEEVLTQERKAVEGYRDLGWLPAARYEDLLRKLGGPLDPASARAAFRDAVQLAWDHSDGEAHALDLLRSLARDDMRAVGLEALPDEIELDRVTLKDGRVFWGSGGPLLWMHPDADQARIAGQRFLLPYVGLPSHCEFSICPDHGAVADRAKHRFPGALLVRVVRMRLDDKCRLAIDGEWERPGKGTVREEIALDLVHVGSGGTTFANEAEGLRTLAVTASIPDLRRHRDLPKEWTEHYGWDAPADPPAPAAPAWPALAELRAKAPGVAWPEPFNPEPAVLERAKARGDLIDADAEASLLRIRFALTYDADLPEAALKDPRGFLALEDAVRAFLRGGPIEPVLERAADRAAAVAAFRRAPDFDPPPAEGRGADGAWTRFPKDYSPWRRWPVLLVLSGYKTIEKDFRRWCAYPGTSSTIVLAPPYELATSRARAPKDDAAVLGTLRRLCLERNADPDRIWVTGCFAGGSKTWRLVESYPSRWAAAGPELAAPMQYPGGYLGIRSAAAIPMFVMESEFDGYHTFSTRRAVEELRSRGATIVHVEAGNWGLAELEWLYPSFLRWVRDRRRDAHPRRVEHRAMNVWEGRQSWLAIRGVANAASFRKTDGEFSPYDLAGVRATLADGRLDLEAAEGSPAEIEIFHDERAMPAEMEIRLDKRLVKKWKPEWDLREALERAREWGEREQVYGDSIRVRFP
jgi:hypothetical protein